MPRPSYRTDRVVTAIVLAATVALAGCAGGPSGRPDPGGADPRSGTTDPARSQIPTRRRSPTGVHWL